MVKVDKDVALSPLYDFYEALSELIKDISLENCADAYAQTLVYGLFPASYYHHKGLDRDSAHKYIPRNIKVIKRIFSNISGDYLPTNVSWIIDDIISILNASEIENILTQISDEGWGRQDPFYVFYEDFLAFYEPERRKHMGVYYTPTPVVKFIVSAIHHILINEFDKPTGFVEDSVTVLDPAVGTGSFLSSTFVKVLDELRRKGLKGLIPKKVENHLLRDFYGFEILITPYIITHLKLTLLLNYYYRFQENDRIGVYLTNTLDPFETHGHIPFFRELAEESKKADELKLKAPLLVILGNPPYSRSSANKSQWIMEKMKDYKKNVGGQNIQPLDDDYIKFIRFAQWKIDQNGEGIVGFISNNRYLDGGIHKQMRKSLLYSFNRIYLVNLHGSARETREISQTRNDENVFDIKQGVSIGIFIKNNKITDKKVYYAELCTTREEKYLWLDKNTIDTISWTEIKPEEPYYFSIPKDFTLKNEYLKFKPVYEIFHLETIGVTTHRDKFVVDFTEDELVKKLDLFKSNEDDEAIQRLFDLKDTRDWKFRKARAAFKQIDYADFIRKYAYRPFDTRVTCYTPILIELPREKIMKHLLNEDSNTEKNMALILPKTMLSSEFSVFVVDCIVDKHILTTKDDNFHVFPLYLRRNEVQQDKAGNVNWIATENSWIPNFTKEFVAYIQQLYSNCTVTPKQVMGYIYAILHSPTYIGKYDAFLKIDFPRINFVEDYHLFKRLAELGIELINLHLMKTNLETTTIFDIPGSNAVNSIKYEKEKVYINKTQFFGGIPENVWMFYLGSFQVLDKWLKSRKNRELSSSEIEHFLQVVEIIKKTIDIMKEIDGVASF